MRRPAGLFAALVATHAIRHKTRTLLTIASVAVGVAVVVAVAIANQSAIVAFEDSARYVSAGAPLEVVTDGPGFADATVARVRSVSGIADASPIVAGSATDPKTLDAYDLVGVDFLAAPTPMSVSVSASASDARARSMSVLRSSIFFRGSIVVSSSLAARLRTALGGHIAMLVGTRKASFLVAGVVDDAAMPFGARSIIVCDVSTAQEALGRIGRIDRIEIVPSPGADLAALRLRLARALPAGARLSTPLQRSATIAKMTEAFRFNLAALAAIALLVGGFLVFNAVSMSVVQRRVDIGIARALGATRGAIFGVFFLEGALVGVAGSAVGLVVGRSLAGAALHIVAGTIDALYVGTNPTGFVDSVRVYFAGAVVGIGTSIAASLLPAREASSVPPSSALRPGAWEMPASASLVPFAIGAVGAFTVAWSLTRLPAVDGKPLFGYAAALAILVGSSLLAPLLVAAAARFARAVLPSSAGVSLQLAPANLRGRVRRNAVAVASLMIGVAMTVSIATMIASFRQSVETWIGVTLRGDLYIRPLAAVNADDVTMPESLARRLGRVRGVAAVDFIRSKQIDVSGHPAFVAASNVRVTSTFGYLPLIAGGTWEAVGRRLIGAKNAVASEPFARKFGVGPGDVITLEGVRGPAPVRIVGLYEDYSSDSGFVFLDIGTYRELFGDDGLNGISIYGKPGVDVDTLRGRVQSALAGENVVVQTNGQLRDDALTQFDRTFAVTSVLDAIAVTVALMGIVATLAALVLERRREIGVLRCLGMTRGQVRAMIVSEALLLGIFGSALGIATGYALAWVLVFVINPQAFGWTIGFRATPLYDAAVFAGVAMTAALAGFIPAASAARIRIADAVRAQ